MASKENTTSATDSQQQQPVVDRDKVKQEREARRLAKLASKQKVQDKSRNLPNADDKKVEVKPDKKAAQQSPSSPKGDAVASDQNTHRKTHKHGKGEQKKESKPVETIANDLDKLKISSEPSQAASSSKAVAVEIPEKKQLSKSERRAIQEAQRAAKAAKATEKPAAKMAKKESSEPKAGPSTGARPKHENTPSTSRETSARKATQVKKSQQHRVKLFNHLYADISHEHELNKYHPAIVRLGVQYSSGVVKGCNARGLAFMSAIKQVIVDYETPPQKEFSRSLEDVIKTCGNYLQQSRPLAVSVTNAMKFIQFQLRQLPKNESDTEQKDTLIESIDTYVREQIDKAAEAISQTVQQKISDEDVILTFGCSSVILNILNEAKKSRRNFRVIVVDARPWHEGREMLRRLVAKNIKCTCVLINAAGFIMPEVTKVLLGAHALLANGYVMSRAGTAQIALIAKSYNVPVLVCCETHKFSERVQTDAFVYNEIGNPYDVVKSNEINSPLANWESVPNLTPLNLYYDVTPPELVSAVITELAILPCTSVPVILRKRSEIGY